MDGVPANYLGRLVSKEHFRAFIYAPDGTKRLVESWAEFEANMQTGIWFATAADATASLAPVAEAPKPRPLRLKKARELVTRLELKDEAIAETDISDYGVAFEVTDDFLSDASK